MASCSEDFLTDVYDNFCIWQNPCLKWGIPKNHSD